jgi:plastocyanin
MKNHIIYCFFIIFSTIIIVTIIPSVFADHHEIIIKPIPNSGSRDVCGESLGVDCYTPNPVTIDVGDKIIFSNTDTEPHFFTSGQLSDNKIGITFDSDLLISNGNFTWSPEVVGKFSYFCPIHPWKQGLINVVEKITESEPGEIINSSTTEVEKINPNSTELYVQPTTDTIEIAPQTESVSEKPITTIKVCGSGTELVNGICQVVEDEEPQATGGGGCLIATAAYGTELAPQVQFLREIRDNTVMSTASGTSFMTGFNQLYYSFSPTIADLERENPMLQEAVRAFITPMISTLSIMTLAEDGSEAEVLGLGISVIALNLGMYIGIPIFGIFKLYKLRHTKFSFK